MRSPWALKNPTLTLLPTFSPERKRKLSVRVLVPQSCPTLWDSVNYIACQAPLSMEFSRQESWSGLPFPSPGDLPVPRIKPGSPALQADSLLSKPQVHHSREPVWAKTQKGPLNLSRASINQSEIRVEAEPKTSRVPVPQPLTPARLTQAKGSWWPRQRMAWVDLKDRKQPGKGFSPF